MSYESRKELRTILNLIIEHLGSDPEIGKKLADAKSPHRFEVEDMDLVLNVDALPEPVDGQYLRWEFSDDVDWEPVLELKMKGDVVNKFFYGKINVPIAVAKRQIKVGGDLKKGLRLMPLIETSRDYYRELVETDYPHLRL